VCYCAHLVSLPTRTRVVLLQHPRERYVPIGTARLAHLCLPGSELLLGVDFDTDARLAAALAAPDGRPAHLLFPGPAAVDVAEVVRERSPRGAEAGSPTQPIAGGSEPFEGSAPMVPITLVVVDGTWSQARSLVHRNAVLSALPQLRFTPPAPSNYRIRREPADDYVATVEALAHVLGALEGAPDRFATLLRPFDAMIDTQLRFAAEVRGARTRHALHRARKAARPQAPSLLRARGGDVVCLHGEANAWPSRPRSAARGLPRPEPAPAPAPEIVHWVARRASSGEMFEAIIAPRRPLAPAIPRHIGIPSERLAAGESWASFRERWSTFTRPDDVFCTWGHYSIGVLESEGVALPTARLDIRPAVGAVLGGRTGSVEDCPARLGVAPPPPIAAGRAGVRLAALAAVVDKLLAA